MRLGTQADRGLGSALRLGARASVVSMAYSAGTVRFLPRRGTFRPSDVCLLVLALVAVPPRAEAQPVEVESTNFSFSAWVGFQFTSSITTSGGSLNIDAAPTYGAAFTFPIAPELQAELLWTLTSTEAHFISSAGPASSGQDHLDINYFQAGLTKSIRCADFECFGDFTLGAVLLAPGALLLGNGQRLNVQDTWRASFTFGAGIRFRVVQQLAVELQARLLVPFFITGVAFYAGSGGSVLVVSAGIPCVEGAFSAGLMLAL